MTLCLAWCKADLETKNWRQVTYFGVDPKKYSEKVGNWDSNMRRASWDQKTAFLWQWVAENHCSVWGLSAWVLRTGWLNSFCRYQSEERPFGWYPLELRPEWWGRLGLVKIWMQNIPGRGNSRCKGPEVETSLPLAGTERPVPLQ